MPFGILLCVCDAGMSLCNRDCDILVNETGGAGMESVY